MVKKKAHIALCVKKKTHHVWLTDGHLGCFVSNKYIRHANFFLLILWTNFHLSDPMKFLLALQLARGCSFLAAVAAGGGLARGSYRHLLLLLT